jgi:hypothetical protein
MNYKEMWEELKVDIEKDRINLQRLYDSCKEDRIKGKVEGIKLAQNRMLILETVYKDEYEMIGNQ